MENRKILSKSPCPRVVLGFVSCLGFFLDKIQLPRMALRAENYRLVIPFC